MKQLIQLLLVSIIFASNFSAVAQESKELPPTIIITYDLKSQVQPAVPFDVPFGIKVAGVQTDDIEAVDVYETSYKYGSVSQVETCFRDANGRKVSTEIRDFKANVDPDSKELVILFPPIKPNKTFAIHLRKKLSPECKALLTKFNVTILTGTEKDSDFDKVIECTREKTTGYTYFGFNESDKEYVKTYKTFFNDSLKVKFTLLGKDEYYSSEKSISLLNIQALDSVSSRLGAEYSDCKFLYEMFRRDKCKEILLGKENIYNAFSLNSEDTADNYDFVKRLLYLQANLKFFDDALQRCTKVQSRGISKVKFGGKVVDIEILRKEFSEFRQELYDNTKKLEKNLKIIDKIYDEDLRFRQSISLGAGTLSMNLVTEGGNIFFLDLGITTLFAKDLKDEMAYLPKLYIGASVYFRPIDKNTRDSGFRRKKDLKPALNRSCRAVNGHLECGPDYGVVSTWSIWQHLSLNIGITFGAMQNKDFDNFFTSNSLLLGPAYRFKRAFKVGAGLSLLRRSSKNPLISDKEVIPGAYVSLSVDVDFIKPLTDLTKTIFK